AADAGKTAGPDSWALRQPGTGHAAADAGKTAGPDSGLGGESAQMPREVEGVVLNPYGSPLFLPRRTIAALLTADSVRQPSRGNTPDSTGEN
ncbi:MAG: hypothetical protein Q4D81_15440, partial [Eubacteriales bacterium]|nr:hypothetical protein [Eubacteriales bacterium]